MNQAGIKRSAIYTTTTVAALMCTGAVTASALVLASTETSSGGLLAGIIIKLVNLFIKLVLIIA